MILAVRKTDNKVFEVVGCGGLAPISILEDLKGNQMHEADSNLKLIFEKDKIFKEYLSKRV